MNKELIKDLKKLQKEIYKRDEALKGLKKEKDINEFMDKMECKYPNNEPKKDELLINYTEEMLQPVEIEPKTRKFANFKEMEELKKPELKLTGFAISVGLTAFLWIPSLVMIIKDINRPIASAIFAECICVMLFLLIVELIKYARTCSAYQKDLDRFNLMYSRYVEETTKRNNYNKMLLLKYQNTKKEYDIEYNSYKMLVDEYEKEYKFKYNTAMKKMNSYNKELKNKVDEDFEKRIEKLNLDYPKTYYDKIDIIIFILESGRADTVKEAIKVYEDDVFKQKLLNSLEDLED